MSNHITSFITSKDAPKRKNLDNRPKWFIFVLKIFKKFFNLR